MYVVNRHRVFIYIVFQLKFTVIVIDVFDEIKRSQKLVKLSVNMLLRIHDSNGISEASVVFDTSAVFLGIFLITSSYCVFLLWAVDLLQLVGRL